MSKKVNCVVLEAARVNIRCNKLLMVEISTSQKNEKKMDKYSSP